MTFDEIKTKLGAKTVGIAGAGGLGSNCAVALARVGVGRLVIADFDVVSEGNLNRQYYFADQVGSSKVEALRHNIIRINPAIDVEIHNIRLDPGNIPVIYRNCDIIVEAFDHAEMKQMIAETVSSEFPDRYLVMGSGLAGFGNNEALRETRIGNIIICGDMENEATENLPPVAPRVGIVASMQANSVLEILLGIKQ